MTESCCSDTQCEVDGSCPSSGRKGKPVAWQTVAALTVGRVPPNQSYWLCEDPDCPVVYFGADGRTVGVGDVAPVPGFKAGGDGLVCYCFLYRQSDLERDVAEGAPKRALDAITDEVKARNCACEVRNPTGKCCLGAIRRDLSRLEDRRRQPVTS